MNITKLTTDGRREPLGLDNKAPAFSWQLTGEGYQQDYRILVASSRSLLEADAADLWDSGTVVSGESVRVPYDGRALESCTRYFWKVISGGIESEITWFETAFLDPEREFKAEWIGQPLGFSGAADDVRFDFEIEKPVKSALLRRCARNGTVLSERSAAGRRLFRRRRRGLAQKHLLQDV